MRGFAKNIRICSNYMAELWGLLEGLILVLDLGIKRVEVNVYSSEIVLEGNQGGLTEMKVRKCSGKLGVY